MRRLCKTDVFDLHYLHFLLHFNYYYYCFVGQVVWVGSSSLDIAVEVHRNLLDAGSSVPMLVPDTPSRVLSSIFTYVARDKLSGKAQKVNR